MNEMKEKIDEILEKVKLPESGLSLSQSGIIEKLRYVSSRKKLIVVKNPIHSSEGCCTLISNFMLNSVLKELRKELKDAFPGFSIEIV
jgi:metal-sulfur cluster biosynthetic enzyme